MVMVLSILILILLWILILISLLPFVQLFICLLARSIGLLVALLLSSLPLLRPRIWIHETQKASGLYGNHLA